MFSEAVRADIAITPTAGAAGATPINGAIIDMANFTGVVFVVQFGAIVAGAVTSIKAQQGAQANMSDAADLAGTGQTVADDADDKCFFIDVKNPTKRYVRLVVSRATQNATCSAMAYSYGPSSAAVSHGSNVAGERHASPAEGTA
jgi:hypothetical protein